MKPEPQPTPLDPASVEVRFLELTARKHRVTPVLAAKALQVPRARVQKAIESLLACGLVATARNPHDQRMCFVSLTHAGESMALSLRRAAAARMGEAPAVAKALQSGLDRGGAPRPMGLDAMFAGVFRLP